MELFFCPPFIASLASRKFSHEPTALPGHLGRIPPADRIARALEDSAHGLEPAGDPWTRPEIDRIEDLWFEHILRHSHMRPRLESRQFLAEVRA